ncbi:MAG: hypothetical protein ACRDDY_04255 [Clostridium sp.]|uniref:hypothetical protein n=1 Tax=Clostridium sp. TaxID=1506 RepID=UPI003EE60ABF
MKVHELIEELQKVKDKNKEVVVECEITRYNTYSQEFEMEDEEFILGYVNENDVKVTIEGV